MIIEYKTPLKYRGDAAKRRALLQSLGKCINGPLVGNVGRSGVVHGEPVKSGRCARCVEAYEASK